MEKEDPILDSIRLVESNPWSWTDNIFLMIIVSVLAFAIGFYYGWKDYSEKIVSQIYDQPLDRPIMEGDLFVPFD